MLGYKTAGNNSSCFCGRLVITGTTVNALAPVFRARPFIPRTQHTILRTTP
jgi:hypothetical protein